MAMLIIVLMAVVTLSVLINIWNMYDETQAKKMCDEYREAFPGKCIICGYHAFGLREYLTREPRPKPHDCCENYERWN